MSLQGQCRGEGNWKYMSTAFATFPPSNSSRALQLSFKFMKKEGWRREKKRVCMSPGTERTPILQPRAEAPGLPGGSRHHPGASVPGRLTQWNAQLWKSSHFFTVKHAHSCWHHTPKYNNFCHLETLSVLLPTDFSFFAVISGQKQCQWIKWTA